jgi:hypothetical protein
MKRSTSGWTTAIAAAALIGIPAASLAQTPDTPHTPSQPPATQSPAAPSEQTAQSTANTPAEHIAAAKQALASIDASTVPASAKPQLAQLRTHLNNLEKEVSKGTDATSAKGSSKWGTDASAVDKIVTSLVGAEGATSTATSTEPSATGTSGHTAATLDETTKDKLRDVRRQMTEMAAAMSGTPSAGAAAATSPTSSTPSTPASEASPSANPTASQPSATTPSTPSATPQSEQPPASTTPQSEQQPPASATPQTAEPQSTQPSAAPAGQADRDAAKQHLSEARESLSQIAAMPEASKLQGETRTQVSQLISNFNELITTQNDWKAAYAKVENSVNALLGPDSGAASPSASPDQPTATTGTQNPPAAAGTTGANAGLDPAIRAKLVEFRTHLKEFEQAAGGGATASPSAPSTATPPAASTASETNPATPSAASSQPDAASASAAAAQPPASATPSAAGTPGAAGTSGSMTPTATDRPAATSSNTAEVNSHLDAIDAILSQAHDGKLSKDQAVQLKAHVDALRQLIKQ